LNHRLKIILLVCALIIVSAFPAAGHAGQSAGAESHPRGRTDGSSKRESAREGEMRDVLMNHAHGTKGAPTGTWGGEHIEMKVSERSAEVEFDCAHATIPRRIVLDRRGRFDIGGTYVEEHGGPVREGAQAGGYAVRFAGRLTGETMRLTVRRVDTKEIIGTFTLARGREASLVKCR
jgi:hypothetical protein